MANDLCRVVSETEVKCSPHKFYEKVKYGLHHLPTIFPEAYTDCKILQGNGETEGSLRQWKYILPGSTEEHTVVARTTKQDDENMIIALSVEEGDIHNHYKHFTAIVQVIPKGTTSIVKWTVEFQKHHDEIPDPHIFLQLFNKLSEKVDDHVSKDSICLVESETEVKCSPQKFYKQMKYGLHHLPTIFPEGYTDCKILEGDGESEGSLRQWKYILPGATEEHTVRARTTKQDDKNMIITLFVEEGNIHDHYKHFTAIVQVSPKGKGSIVKWIVEFEKHHDEIPEPHLFLQLFDALTEKVDAHIRKA